VQVPDVHLHSLRRDLRDVRLHRLLDVRRILIGNPLDAFSSREQRLYLDWLAGRPAGDIEATRVQVVLVALDSGPQRRLAGRNDFRELARDTRAVLYVRSNRHSSGADT